MNIIVSGGGTGGHIYPAITIIRTIQQKVPDARFLYVGTKRGLEADIIPKEGLPFTTVDIQGFERHLTADNILRAGRAMVGVAKATRIVHKFKPDVVIGTGGYVCGPILLAASLMHIPTLIQEQNVVPGITNKILSKFVTKIAAGTEEAMKHFPADKVVFTGNPIRSEVLSAQREQGAASFGLDPKKLTVLVSGGSRGARAINLAMIGVIKNAASRGAVLACDGQARLRAGAQGARGGRCRPYRLPAHPRQAVPLQYAAGDGDGGPRHLPRRRDGPC